MSTEPVQTEIARLRARRRWSALAALALLLAIVAGVAALFLRTEVSQRANMQRIIDVVIPPPEPEPPPPEPEQVAEVTPQETPMDAPSEAAPDESNDALTADVGQGPNMGQQAGDGSGQRIGGTPGAGDAARAYGSLLERELRRLLQANEDVRGRYSIRLEVRVTPEGVVETVRFIAGSGNARRDAAIERLFVGTRLSQAPPPNVPSMIVAYQSRSGA